MVVSYQVGRGLCGGRPNQRDFCKVLIDNVVCQHGVPFQTEDLTCQTCCEVCVCELLGMKKVNTTPYHPQTDSLEENMNHTIHAVLAKRMHTPLARDWDDHLQQLLFDYSQASGVDPSSSCTEEAPGCQLNLQSLSH